MRFVYPQRLDCRQGIKPMSNRSLSIINEDCEWAKTTQYKIQSRRVIVTAGPTQEPIDPVRFLTNHSSGKMGYAIARAAVEAGNEVILISGPVAIAAPDNVQLINVTTAKQMYAAVMAVIDNCDIFIATAAVADYTPKQVSQHKIKKREEQVTLELQKTPDILAAVAALTNSPFTVGFAAETENLIANAQAKLVKKKLDMVIANRVGPDQGFNSDKNAVTILRHNYSPLKLPLMPKLELAREIIAIVNNLLK